jgi:hypothetical protein
MTSLAFYSLMTHSSGFERTSDSGTEQEASRELKVLLLEDQPANDKGDYLVKRNSRLFLMKSVSYCFLHR